MALSNVLFGQKLQTPGGVIESTDPTSAEKDIVLKTNNNAVNQGLSFQNSGGNYTYRIYREEIITPENWKRYNLRFSGGSGEQYINDLANKLTLSYNGDLILYTGDIRLENSASKLFLGQNNVAGPHGIVFDDESGSQLSFLYRSTPNQLRVEKTNDESSIFTVDADNSNVGIGTNTPLYGRLQITQKSDASDQGLAVMNATGNRSIRIWTDEVKSYIYSGNDGSGKLILNGDGYVGIGTNNPAGNLHIQNNVQGEVVKLVLMGSKNATTFPNASLQFDPMSDAIFLSNGNEVGVSVNNYGNVGIGMKGQSNNLGYKLAVNGTIGAKEVVVENSSDWPDYVFAKNYNLRSLDELKEHIEITGHLPNIPSATEVAEKGISLGEMNAKLLEKVEELTLYIIQQNEQIQSLNKRVELLED